MSSRKLSIVQMNDSHAYFQLHQEMFWAGDHAVYRRAGGYARIATLLKKVRKEGNVLFCDCGDTFHGTVPAVRTKGRALLPVMNSLGIDAMTAHWEFAYFPEEFHKLADDLNYPMLAINIYFKNTKKQVYPSYVIKEVNRLKIGLIGIASNIIDKTMPPSFSEGIYFTSGREELPQVIEMLKNQEKVDLIILISHLGFVQDMKLLQEVTGIDVCLSGHTHNRLYKPVVNGKTIVIQSGCHGSFLGLLDVEVEDGKIISYKHRLTEVEESITPDPGIDDLIHQSLSPFKEELSEIVGEIATSLNRGTALESTMDNFLLQSLIASTGSQLAFSNVWRYGAPVVTGKVTLNDLYNIIPMDPPVSTTELTGDEIRHMLEENLERTFSCDPFQQMGGYVKRCLGLNIYFKIENPKGHRIQKIFVGNEELLDEKYYQTAFVTVQGVPQQYGRNREDTSVSSIDAMRKYLKKPYPPKAELSGTFTAI